MEEWMTSAHIADFTLWIFRTSQWQLYWVAPDIKSTKHKIQNSHLTFVYLAGVRFQVEPIRPSPHQSRTNRFTCQNDFLWLLTVFRLPVMTSTCVCEVLAVWQMIWSDVGKSFWLVFTHQEFTTSKTSYMSCQNILQLKRGCLNTLRTEFIWLNSDIDCFILAKPGNTYNQLTD